MQSRRILFVLPCLIVTGQFTSAFADLASDHAMAVAESEKPVAVAGGVTFAVNRPRDDTFRAVVTALQKSDYTLDSASLDTGEIFTSLQITGSWHQTGTRVCVTIFADSPKSTTIRVAVSEQGRFKAFSTDPWGTPKLNLQKSAAVAALLQKLL